MKITDEFLVKGYYRNYDGMHLLKHALHNTCLLYTSMLLQISKRTLQRYRSVGALPYKTLGKKTYYSEEDVLTFLSNHIKDFKKEDIAFYKARIHNFFHK